MHICKNCTPPPPRRLILLLQPADEKKTKMDVAKEVLAGIVDQLEPRDSLSIVLFRQGSYLCMAASADGDAIRSIEELRMLRMLLRYVYKAASPM